MNNPKPSCRDRLKLPKKNFKKLNKNCVSCKRINNIRIEKEFLLKGAAKSCWHQGSKIRQHAIVIAMVQITNLMENDYYSRKFTFSLGEK